MGGLLNPLCPRLKQRLIPMTHTTGLSRASKTSRQGRDCVLVLFVCFLEQLEPALYDAGMCSNARKLLLGRHVVVRSAQRFRSAISSAVPQLAMSFCVNWMSLASAFHLQGCIPTTARDASWLGTQREPGWRRVSWACVGDEEYLMRLCNAAVTSAANWSSALHPELASSSFP